MRCPACGTESPPTAKFCAECGARLLSTCSQCGQEVDPAAKFCQECGSPLGRPARPGDDEVRLSPHSYTPRHLAEKILASRTALEGEHKQVTVLFADVVGSTELIRDLDAEQAQSLLDAAMQRMMEAVHRFEGTVSRLTGDGLMALFGAPLAHEDHAVRACFAALAMQAAMRTYAEEARRSHGVAPAIRVGLNSGEVVVRLISDDLHMDYTAMGQTVHLAARMEQLARPETTTLAPSTLALAEGYVQARSLGPVPVKGLDEPLEVFELLGAGMARTRLQAAAQRGLTRFVGRQMEMDSINRAVERAHAGHGQLVSLMGEPGVGKSRLVWEVTHSHRTQGWTVFETSSVSYGKATSYLPVIEALKSYCGIEARDDQRQMRGKLIGKLLALDRTLEAMLPPLLALLDLSAEDSGWEELDPSQRRRLTLDAVRRLLLRESQEQPLLLVFEDLHWIDGETQALLDSLVESLPTARVLLFVDYRPEYEHRWGGKTYYTQLRIDPLPRESADELLDTLLGPDVDGRDLKRLLIERTEGNPFFLEECVRSLVEVGVLVGERGAYRIDRSIDVLRVPATIQSVLAARIDRLPPEDKRLLQTAAVIGKDVPYALLRGVTGGDEGGADPPAESVFRDGLARLQTAEFLYEANLFPELEYTFKHALTHEVAYGSLLTERRKALHAGVVDAIEALFPDRLDEYVERLAHHALQGEVWEKALSSCRQAGRKAVARSANREAVGHFEHALAALEHLAESRHTLEQAIDLRLDLRQALTPLEELELTLEHLRHAEAQAAALGDQYRLGRTLAHLAYAFFRGGERDRAIQAGERALAIGRVLDDVPLQVVAQLHLAFPHRQRGDYRRAIAGLRWVATATQGELLHERYGLAIFPAVLSRALLAQMLAELGEFAEGTAFAEEAVRLAEALDHPHSLSMAQSSLGLLSLRQGHPRRAIPLLEQALELFERWDLPQLGLQVTAWLGSAYVLDGRAVEGVPLLEQAEARVGSGTVFRGPFAVWLGEGYLLAGQLEEANQAAGRGLDLCRQRRQRGYEAYALRLLGEVAGRRDAPDADGAEPRYREALGVAEELGMRPLQARCHLGLGRLYRRVGRLDEARDELNTAVEMLRLMEMTLWLPEAEAELAQIATHNEESECGAGRRGRGAVSMRFGCGDYQYELVEGWPKVEIDGAVADVACDSRGRVYAGVRNRQPDGKPGNILGGGGHVLVLDRDGNVVGNWGDICSAPHGVWINQDDEIFLADTGHHTITKHAPSGELLLTLGTQGRTGRPGEPFNMPTHAVQAPNGDIFVSDGYGQNRIHRFSARGEHILSFGSGDSVFLQRRFGSEPASGTPGTGPGQFNVPHDLLVDRDSRVYVMDRENDRWQVFTLEGDLLSICAGVNHPNKALLDADGNFHLVGGAGVEIRMPDGSLIGSWGETGSEPGQFVTGSVHGGWIDAEGALYTAEAGFLNRLQKFARVV